MEINMKVCQSSKREWRLNLSVTIWESFVKWHRIHIFVCLCICI